MNHRCNFITLIVALLFILSPAVLQASAELPAEFETALELALESYEASYFPGEDVRWQVEMEIVDSRGRTRGRELTILRKNLAEYRQKYYAYFHQPSQLSRMVFLVWTQAEADDDRWLYMPATDMVQRISGRQKRSSFAGSDFTYEDMTGRHPAQDQFSYLGVEELDGRQLYLLRGEPLDSSLVEFAHYKMYIDTETLLALRGEFYDPQGELHRTLTVEQVEEIDGYPTPIVQRAKNHSTGSETVNTMSEIEYDLGIPENIFQERYLRRPPTPWITP